MPLNWQNHEATQEVNEENMKKALMGVMFKGETPSCAARKYGLKRTTILYRLLRERKRCSPDTSDCKIPLFGGIVSIKRESDRKFQSKFTSQQLLSAQQEENLSEYLKEKYEQQYKETGDTTLISEATARNFVYNFARINNIRCPASWDPKQQAGGDWFNGFVDRNPEVIEYVAPAVKLRRRRRRTKYALNKVNSKIPKRDSSDYDHEFGQWAPEPKTVSTPKLTNIADAIQYDHLDNSQPKQSLQTEHSGVADYHLPDQGVTQFKIKVENNYDSEDFGSHSHAQFFTSDSYYNENPMVPELVYHNSSSPNAADDIQSSNSIAQNVKRRAFRKPRVIPEIRYPPNHIPRKDGSTTLSINEILNKEELNTSQQEGVESKNLETILEKINQDMGHYMQTIIGQMIENNRLLKKLVECSTKTSQRH